MPTHHTVHISPPHSPVLKRWNDLTPLEKISELVRYAAQRNGYAITLKLLPSFQTYLNSTPRPMREVSKRINTELNATDLPRLPILLVLETTRHELNTHLHGVVIPDGIPLPKIQQVLRNGVGYVQGHQGSRQFMAKKIYKPDGWTKYITMDFRFTRRLLSLPADARLVWVSRSLTQLARVHYERLRQSRVTTANLNTGPTARVS